jgi:hypothetical protein
MHLSTFIKTYYIIIGVSHCSKSIKVLGMRNLDLS